MRAAARHLQDVGDIPDELLGGRQLFHGALDAPLELAEPLLARHQVGRAGFEHRPALALESFGQQPQERRLAHPVLAAHEQRPRGRLQRRGLGRHQRLLPRLGLDQELSVLPVRPEPPERGEKRAIDAGALDAVELPDERGGVRMMNALEKCPDLGRRGGIAGAERGAERGRVSQPLPLGEVVAEEPGHDQIVAPPILGAGHGIAHRRSRLDGEEIRKREVDRPGIELLEVRDDLVAALAAVGAPSQRREAGARQRPVGAERVLHDRVEGHAGIFQQPDGFRELRLVLELARVREIGGQGREHGLQAVQARGERRCRGRRAGVRGRLRGGRGRAWIDRGGLGLRGPRPRELPARPRREPQPDGQTDNDSEEMLQVLESLGAPQLSFAWRVPSLMGSTYCRSRSQGKKIQVSCETSVMNVSHIGAPAGLA